ncbi:MAG: LD-carboxypeptidase [Myxococcales bacterium]|nr:LD-carboxypeptidase [Myxococcales bacterium]
MRAPPALRPKSRVAVVAPASGFPREELVRGLAVLADRYTVTMRSGAFSREGYLAGSDARRAEELAWAMTADGIEAIVCARGGYGITRIVDGLPWDAFVTRPRWIVGFSDVTALHLEAQARGIASVHAANVTGLSRTTPRERLALVRILEHYEGPVLRDLEVVHDGPAATGVVVGGNLTLVECQSAAGALVVPEGAVLVLEDVTERPYRLDRMLTSLGRAGHLGRVSAIVLGDLTDCTPGPDGVTAEAVLRERTACLGVPVLAGAPFGHGRRNMPIPLGFTATVRPLAGTCTFAPPTG